MKKVVYLAFLDKSSRSSLAIFIWRSFLLRGGQSIVHRNLGMDDESSGQSHSPPPTAESCSWACAWKIPPYGPFSSASLTRPDFRFSCTVLPGRSHVCRHARKQSIALKLPPYSAYLPGPVPRLTVKQHVAFRMLESRDHSQSSRRLPQPEGPRHTSVPFLVSRSI